MRNNQVDLEKLIGTYTKLCKNSVKSEEMKTMITVYQNTDNNEISISLYNCAFSNGNISPEEEEIFSTTDKYLFDDTVLPVLLGIYSSNNIVESQDIKETPFDNGLNYAAVGSVANLQLENFDKDTLNRVVETVNELEAEKDDSKKDAYDLALQYAKLSLRISNDINEERELYEQVDNIIASTNGSYSKLKSNKKEEYLRRQLETDPENKVLQRILTDVTSKEKKDELISIAFKLANFKLKHKDFLEDKNNEIIIEVAKEAVRDGYLDMPNAAPKIITGDEKVKTLDLDSVSKVNYWDKKRKEFLQTFGEEAQNKASIAKKFEERASKVSFMKSKEYYETMKDLLPSEDEITPETTFEENEKYVSESYKKARADYKRAIDPESKMSDVEFETVINENRAKLASEKHLENSPKEALDILLFAQTQPKEIEPVKLDIPEETNERSTELEEGINGMEEAPKKEETIEELTSKLIDIFNKLGKEIPELKPTLDDTASTLIEFIDARKNVASEPEDLKVETPAVEEAFTIGTALENIAKRAILPPEDRAHYENFREVAGMRKDELANKTATPEDIKSQYDAFVYKLLNDPKMKPFNDKFGLAEMDRINANSLKHMANPNSSMISDQLITELTTDSIAARKEYEKVALLLAKNDSLEDVVPRKTINIPETVVNMRGKDTLTSAQQEYKEACAKSILLNTLIENGIIPKDEHSNKLLDEYTNREALTSRELVQTNEKYISEDINLSHESQIQSGSAYMKSMDLAKREKLIGVLQEHHSSDLSKRKLGITVKNIDGLDNQYTRALDILIEDVNDEKNNRGYSFKFEDKNLFDNDILPNTTALFGLDYSLNPETEISQKKDNENAFEYTARSENNDFFKLDGFDIETIKKIHTILGKAVIEREKENNAGPKTNTTVNHNGNINSNQNTNPNGNTNTNQRQTATSQQQSQTAQQANKKPPRTIKSVTPPKDKGKIVSSLKKPVVKYALHTLKYLAAISLAWPVAAVLAARDIGKYRETHPKKGKSIINVEEPKGKGRLKEKLCIEKDRIKRGLGETLLGSGIVFTAAVLASYGPVGQMILAGGALGYGAYFLIRKMYDHRKERLTAEEQAKKQQIDAARKAAAAQKNAAQQQAVKAQTQQPTATTGNASKPINSASQNPAPVQQQPTVTTGNASIPINSMSQNPATIKVEDIVEVKPGAKVYSREGFATKKDGYELEDFPKQVIGEIYLNSDGKTQSNVRVTDKDRDERRRNILANNAELVCYVIGHKDTKESPNGISFADPKDLTLANTKVSSNVKGGAAK